MASEPARGKARPNVAARLPPGSEGNILSPEQMAGEKMRGPLLLLAALVAAVPSSAALAAGSGNPLTDSLLAMPEPQRIELLGQSVRHDCVATRAFLMGVTASGPARGTAYWSVACTNGRNFVIQINRDKKGTSFVADCRVLQGTGRECFQPF